jgi:hypothetical protein
MRKETGPQVGDDPWVWTVIGLCFAGVMLALWGPLLWQYVSR